MAKVFVPTLLRPLCEGRMRLELPAATLGDLLQALDKECPGFYDRVVENGAVRPDLAIAINGEAMSYPLFEPLAPETEVTIVPAIGGG